VVTLRQLPRARHAAALACVLALLVFAPWRPARANTPVLAILAGGAALLAHDALTHPALPRKAQWTVSAGGFDIVQFDDPAAEGSIEYRWANPLIWHAKPFAGMTMTTDAGALVFAGLRLDEPLTAHWIAGFDLGAALYAQGHGKDLGSAALGRGGLSLAYRFDNGARLGVSFHHMSHDHLFSSHNPGVETASVTFSWPLH